MSPPPSLITAGQLLLITDELASPADFLLHQLLAEHFDVSKVPQKAKCIVLNVSGNMSRWQAVAAKSVSLSTQHIVYAQVNYLATALKPLLPPTT
jgi:hypothetical protein